MLASKSKLPEGDGYNLVVQFRQTADARPQNFMGAFDYWPGCENSGASREGSLFMEACGIALQRQNRVQIIQQGRHGRMSISKNFLSRG